MTKADADSSKAEVCVIGLGYIGLPTAIFFANSIGNVVGVDVDTQRVHSVNQGQLPFMEPGLHQLLEVAVKEERLKAQTEIPRAENYIISVPTPIKEDSGVDLSYIYSVLDELRPILSGGELIVLESTAPPGTSIEFQNQLKKARADLDWDSDAAVQVAYCPERVIPGQIVQEMPFNDRVIGAATPHAGARAKALYSTFCRGEIAVTDSTTAEIVKLAENSYRDINIAFANELSLVCEAAGTNVKNVIKLANRHPRVKILSPGPGVGGHCIAVDPWFIASSFPEITPLIRTARYVNDNKPQWVSGQVSKLVEDLTHPVISMFGVSFKADVDDIRSSPALEVIQRVAASANGGRIYVVDPYLTSLPESLRGLDNVILSQPEEALKASDLAVLLVDHSAFRDIDWNTFRQLQVFDVRPT